MNRNDARPPVRAIRLLGTSWATRGSRYWLRRAWASVFYALLAALTCFVYVAFASGMLSAATSDPARLGIVEFFVLGAAWSACVAMHACLPTIRAQRARDIEALRAVVSGLSPRASSGFGMRVFVCGSAFVVGWPIVLLGMSFRRHLSAEECLAVLELERGDRHPIAVASPPVTAGCRWRRLRSVAATTYAVSLLACLLAAFAALAWLADEIAPPGWMMATFWALALPLVALLGWLAQRRR